MNPALASETAFSRNKYQNKNYLTSWWRENEALMVLENRYDLNKKTIVKRMANDDLRLRARVRLSVDAFSH